MDLLPSIIKRFDKQNNAEIHLCMRYCYEIAIIHTFWQ